MSKQKIKNNCKKIIAEHKKAEEKMLVHSKIITNMLEGVYLIKAKDGIIVYTNPMFEKMFGYGHGEMLGKHVSVVNAPTDKDPIKTAKEITAYINKHGMWKGEILNIKKDGTPFWSYANVSIIDHPEYGKVFVSVHTDITERKKAEEEIKENNKRFNIMQKIAHMGSWHLDLVKNNLWWSDEIYRIFGLKPQQFGATYEAFLKTVHPDDRKMVNEAYISHIKNKKPYNIEHRIVLPNGKISFVEEICDSEWDKNGKPLYSTGAVQDITERKKTEGQVRDLKEYLQLQIDRMPIGLIVWDTEFRVKTWNPAAEKIFGFKEKAVLGKHPYNLIVLKSVQSIVDKIWNRLLKGDKTAHSINENIAKSGRTIICSWANTPLKDANGSVIGVLSMVQDITMQKKSEEALQKAHDELEKRVEERTAELKESEEMYRNLYEQSTDMVQSTDVNGNIMEVNKSWLKIMGYTENEASKLNFQNIIHESCLGHCEMLFKKIMAGKQVSNIDTIFVNKKGEEVYVAGSVQPIIKDGKTIRTWGYFRDVTQQKKAEEEAELYMKGFDSSPSSMILVEYRDKKPYIVHINKSFTRYYMYTEKEVLGKNPRILKSGEKDKKYYKAMWKAILDPKIGYWQSEIKNRKKDGTFIDVLLTNNTIFDENGEPAYFMVHHTDITERKEIDRAKNEFVSLASHQLRTPLTGIKWLIQAVLKKGSLNKWQIEFLEDALKSNDRMIVLVSDLLNISRLEAGVVGVAPKKVNLADFISDLIHSFKPEAVLRKQTIKFIKPHAKIMISIDEELIGQVITNLFSNAIKYSKPNKTITISVKKKEEEEEEVNINVIDQGIGLSKDDQKKLFTKFFRSDQASRMDTKGSGLGLYIIKKILDAHGGKIKVSSKLGKGSTFTVILPLKGPRHKKGGKELITHKMS